MTPPCPESALLRGFIEGGLDPETEERVRTHVGSCAVCRDALGQLPGGTDFSPRPRPSDAGAAGGADAGGPPARIGEFRVIREIGRGGMGIVYEAEQASLGRRVALKVLPVYSLLDRTLVERFKREAQAAARLHHTNIVPVHGAGEEGGLHYFAMEFIDGQGLDRVLRDLKAERAHAGSGAAERSAPSGSSALPSPNTERAKFYRGAAELAVQAADALAYAHAHGVVHRDIKPSNLILDRNSTLWIADFGLARAEGVDPLTQSGDVLGTLGYMAPEGFRGIADEQGDIYGLGITLYELLTLRPAFHDADRRRLIKKVIDEEPLAPRRVDASIPRDLETIVLKAIHKDSKHRYQKAAHLADDLRSFLLDRPIRARRSTALERGWRWCRRNRAVAVLMLVVGATSIAAAAAAWHSWSEGEARRLSDLRSRSDQALWEAQRLYGLGLYDEALASAVRAVELRPSHEARLLEARLLFALERLDDSARILDELLRENPDDGAAHYLMASIYRGRDARRSRYHRSNAERLLENTSEGFHLRALAAPTMRAALDWLDRGLRLEPAHYPSRKMRALTHFALRDFEAMEVDASVAVSHRPADAFNWLLLAMAKVRRGRPEEAIFDLHRAIDLDPGNVEAHAQRRAIHRLLGDHSAELADARRVVELSPGDPVGAFHLVGSLLTSGAFDEATAEYARASGTSWGVKQWFRRALARQVFEDEAARLRYALPDPGANDAIDVIHRYRRIYRELAAKGQRAVRNAYKASWSPDGARLVYDNVFVESFSQESVTYPRVVARRSLRIVDVDSGTDRLLVEDGKDSSWSPDGRWIAFVRQPDLAEQASEEVWLVSLDGGEERRLAQGGYPTWSNEPGRVFFQSRRLNMLCDIAVDEPGTEPRPLVRCAYRYPAISPDGKHLARASGTELQIVDIASSEVTARWTFALALQGLLMEWSPDGNEVSVGCLGFHDMGLWVFDRRSGTARRIVGGPATLGAWSRDGKRLALTIRGQILETWVAALDPARPAAEALAPSLTADEHLAEHEACERQAAERRPGDAAQGRRLARVLEAGGRHDAAAAAWLAAHQRSTKVDSTDLESAARNLAAAGDLAGAIRTLEDALDLPNRGQDAAGQLAGLRAELRPRFASYISIDDEIARTVGVNPRRAVWRIFRGDSEPSADWKEVGFDASSWPVGEMGVGYGPGVAGTLLDDMKGKYSTVYLRRELEPPARLVDLSLEVQADDGFVAFFNGVELGRRRAGRAGSAVRHQDTASMPAPEPVDRWVLKLPNDLRRRGNNVVALVGLNDRIESPDFVVRSYVRASRPIQANDAVFDEFLNLPAAAAAEPGGDALRRLQDYVRARRLQSNGELRAALERLEGLIADDASATEPWLRAAECLRGLGDAEGARQRLRAALQRVGNRRRDLWELWWTLAVVERKDESAGIAGILGEIPEEAGPGAGYGVVIRECLDQLAGGGVLRINCGGDRFVSASGATWLGDRFFECGFPFASPIEAYGAPEPFRGEIAGTEDDALYQTERWFSREFRGHLDADGYRIPLPPGDYRVTLHFAEIYYRAPRRRLFEVVLEERATVEALDLFAAAGFARPIVRQVDVGVRDGFLDIHFVRSAGEPKISALEIQRLP